MGKTFLIAILLNVSALVCFAEIKPNATYISKSLFYYKYHSHKGHHNKQPKSVKCNWIKFEIFKTGVTISIKAKILPLRIVTSTFWSGAARYDLEDEHHLHYRMAIWANEEKDKPFDAYIDFVDCGKDNKPLTKMSTSCRKL